MVSAPDPAGVATGVAAGLTWPVAWSGRDSSAAAESDGDECRGLLGASPARFRGRWPGSGKAKMEEILRKLQRDASGSKYKAIKESCTWALGKRGRCTGA